MAEPGPTERGLIEALTGPMRRRVLHPRHLFTGIKLRTRYDLTVLNEDNAPVDAPPRQVPDCAHCRDKCCADPDNDTVLRLLDVARLVDRGHAAHIEPGDGERAPRLRKQKNGACVFFTEDQTCAIYDDRPIICRRFPYRVADDRGRVTWSTACQSFQEGDPAVLTHEARSSYNQMVTDIAARAYGEKELKALGLWRFVSGGDDG